MYSLKATTKACTVSLRSARAPMRASIGAPVRPIVAVRASSEEPDYGAQASEAITKATAYVQGVWEETADAEKPAIIGILIAVFVAQIAIGAAMDTVDHMPFFGDLFELIGVAVASAYAYRYFTDPAERTSAKATVDGLVAKVTGKK